MRRRDFLLGTAAAILGGIYTAQDRKLIVNMSPWNPRRPLEDLDFSRIERLIIANEGLWRCTSCGYVLDYLEPDAKPPRCGRNGPCPIEPLERRTIGYGHQAG